MYWAGMAEWQSARLESVFPYGILGSNPSPGVILRRQFAQRRVYRAATLPP